MKPVIFFLLALMVIAGCSGPGKYDTLSKCMTEKDVKFYGAFWCPHCANQKEMFGPSIQYVNYIECSTPDKKGQTEACIAAGIKVYPTWELQNGTRIEGELKPEQLSRMTGCPV